MLDEQQLRCVECYGELNSELICRRCGTKYDRAATGAPIVMTPADRERFRALLESEGGSRMQQTYIRRRNSNWLRRFYPPEPVYVNPSAPPIPCGGGPGTHLWIGGAGLHLPGFVNLDVAPLPGVDVASNAARLPFSSGALDSIACLALLEHVEDPNRVVAEMHRVLKPGGEAQVVVPFCHPYHAYPADYSRFSRERLQQMFADFSKVEIGIRTGPTVTMLIFLTYYVKLILPVHGGSTFRRGFNRLIVGAIGWAIFPIKYLDVWLNRVSGAEVLANHLYVVAKR
jgi:SAM-dependent methyltransferase